jgi:hypothetical protein
MKFTITIQRQLGEAAFRWGIWPEGWVRSTPAESGLALTQANARTKAEEAAEAYAAANTDPIVRVTYEYDTEEGGS